MTNMPNTPTLHMICGKIASGKSTLAARLAQSPATVLIAEDDWLSALFEQELHTISDYVRCTEKLRAILGPHIAALLNAGVSVVLDFPANTVETRNWMRGVLDQTKAAHQMHVLNLSDALCMARLRNRNATGNHRFAPTQEQFVQITRHFVVPSPEERFNIITHEPGV